MLRFAEGTRATTTTGVYRIWQQEALGQRKFFKTAQLLIYEAKHLLLGRLARSSAISKGNPRKAAANDKTMRQPRHRTSDNNVLPQASLTDNPEHT